MYTYLLLVFVLVLLLFVLNTVKGDYFFPAAIILEVYILSLSFSIIEIPKWDTYISPKSFNIFITGIFTYVIVALVTRKLAPLRIKKRRTKTRELNKYIEGNGINSKQNPITLDPLICLLISLLSVAVFVVYFRDIRRSSLSIAIFGSFSEMIGNFHDSAVMGTLEVGVSSFSNYGNMIVAAFAYIFVYLNIQDAILHNKIKKYHRILYWIPIVIYILCSIISGSRNPILQIICAAVTLYFIMVGKYRKTGKRFRWKLAARFMIAGFIVLFGFSSFRGLVGRTSDYSFLDYISKYIGGSIKLFDMFVESGKHNTSGIWGQETFVNVWRYIGSKTGDTTLTGLIMNKEWRAYKGFAMGNVYTAFREYYFDFGLLGVVILSAIHSFIFTFAYERLKGRKTILSPEKINFGLLLYAYLSQSLFYFSIDDRFYQAYLARNVVITVIVMFVLCRLLKRIKLRKAK